MYRNDCRLLCRNRNCDLPIHFRTPEWRMTRKKCGPIAAKTARFNSVNSEIITWMLTRFVHDVARILPFNPLTADLRSANPLSNAKAKSKGRSWQRLQLTNLTGCQSNVPWATAKRIIGLIIPNMPTKRVKKVKIGPMTFWDIWRDMPIFAVSS